MLDDPQVRRWFSSMERSSKVGAQQSARTLYRFLEATNLTAQGLLKAKAGKRNDVVTDFIGAILDAKKSGSYAKSYKQAIQSWLAWNGQALTRPIKITGLNVRETLKRAHMPSQEELRQVLHAGDARQRAAVILIAHSGVRPEVLGNFDATDGLRLRDFPEASLKDGVLAFDAMPARINVREELSKIRKPYFTFIGAEGCAYLAAYVRERHEAGEKVTLESPLFVPRTKERPFISTYSVSAAIREPMRASGMHNNPPYIWRSYFSNRTLMAESDGLLHDFRVYMMGHKGSLEIDYGLRKTLQEDVVERMRAGYKAALRYLETTNLAQENPRLALTAGALEMAGYTPEQVSGMQIEKKAPHELLGIMRGAFQKAVHGQGAKQKTVTIEALDEALEAGWVFKSELKNGRILVEAPTMTAP